MIRNLSIPLLGAALLLVSCDERNRIASADPVSKRLAVGDELDAALPGGSGGSVSTRFEFDADSGKTYTVSWSDSGYSVAASVVSGSGDPRYSEAIQASAGFEKSVVFPATHSGVHAIVVTGIEQTSFRIGLRATDGLPAWVAMPDQAEDDGAQSSAKELPVDSSWQYRSLTTLGKPDVDWFLIQADSGYSYSLARVDSLVGGVSMGIYLADSTFLGGTGWYCRKKSTVYCKVAASTGKGGWYRLRALATKGPPSEALQTDEYENDNTLATAKPIATDSSWQYHTLPGPRDLDFISFLADSGSTYRLLFRFSDTTNIPTSPRILGKDSVQLPSDLETIPRGVAVVFPCVRTGRYFAAMSGYGGAGCGYEIAVTRRAGIAKWVVPEIGEPDTGISSATLLPTDSTPLVRSVLFGDTDWVRIHVEAGKVYLLRQKVAKSTYTWIGITTTILGSTGCPFDSLVLYKSDVDTTWTFMPKSDGDIYLRISTTTYNYVRPDDWISLEYRVDVKSPPPDPLEPDGSLSQSALLVADGKSVSRWVAGSDEDWMKIKVDSGRKLEIRVEGALRSAGLSVDLFGADSQWIGSRPDHLPQSGASIEYVPRRTGMVHLRVKSSSSDVQRYVASARQSAGSDSTACTRAENSCVLATDSSWVRTRLLPGASRWFAFPVKAGSNYRIETQASARTDVMILGSAQEPSDSLRISPSTTPYNVYHHASADGIAYVKVDQGTKSDTSSEFNLSISVMTGRWWPVAPSFAGAWETNFDGSSLVGDIIKGTPLFFKFHGDSGTVYSFHLEPSRSMNFGLFSQDSVWQTTSTKANNYSVVQDLSFSPPKTGEWYFKLWNNYYQEVAWRLQATSAPLDAFEDDDSMKSARDLPVDGTVQDHMLWGADVDWVRLEVDSGAEYKLRIEATGSHFLTADAFTADFLPLGSQGYSDASSNNDGLRISMDRRTHVFVCINTSGIFVPGTIPYKIWIDKPKAVQP